MLFVWAYFCTHTHGFPFFLFYPDRKKTIAAGQIAFLFANPLFILLTLALYPSHACACARLFARGVKQQKIKCRKHVIVGFVQSFVHYTTVSDSRRTKDFIVPDAFWRKTRVIKFIGSFWAKLNLGRGPIVQRHFGWVAFRHGQVLNIIGRRGYLRL